MQIILDTYILAKGLQQQKSKKMGGIKKLAAITKKTARNISAFKTVR